MAGEDGDDQLTRKNSIKIEFLRQQRRAGLGVLAFPLACSGAGDYVEDRIEALETRA
jgi:hypothetical protein